MATTQQKARKNRINKFIMTAFFCFILFRTNIMYGKGVLLMTKKRQFSAKKLQIMCKNKKLLICLQTLIPSEMGGIEFRKLNE